MEVSSLKQHILDEDLVEQILEAIGCHHIKKHSRDYITAANKDGDNTSAILVYLNENLTTINYTRQISKTKRTTDLIDLVMFAEDLSFPEALKFVCNELGLDFYNNEMDEIPESLQILQFLKDMQTDGDVEDNAPLKPINPKILNYYIKAGNSLFEKDGISLEVQEEFGVGYDPQTNRVTVPIYDMFGSLVGIKGRLFKEHLEEDDPPKYLFLAKCNKSKLLYGYYENQSYIKNSDRIYVFEAEKSVQQCATMGIRNCVSTMGKMISKTQVDMLTRIGAKIILSYDKDVCLDELQSIADMFMEGVPVYTIYDNENLLSEKMSPSDDANIFYKLKDNLLKLR